MTEPRTSTGEEQKTGQRDLPMHFDDIISEFPLIAILVKQSVVEYGGWKVDMKRLTTDRSEQEFDACAEIS